MSDVISWQRQAWLVFEKDLRVELSTGEVLTTSAFFSLLVVVIASLSFYAGPDAQVLVAPGVIWVTMAFSTVLVLSRTWQRERENDALNGLLALPIDRSALFAGKVLGVMAFLCSVQVVVVPFTALLFEISLVEYGLGLSLFCLGATPGIAAVGTLFGAMTARTAARHLILASVLFPLLAPTLLAAVAGTRTLLGGAPLAELTDYFALMGVFAVVFGAGGFSMFGALLEP